ncbi:hypothetical protein M513_11284 [Trichuris suis]|uniref:Uncharacterized protein n=1 Tax=Trichuris suis TaxID=68888 RepID=A0A085LSC4_9BILA|nr:hypothetical protein M513_11284 [Trichuris suis]
MKKKWPFNKRTSFKTTRDVLTASSPSALTATTGPICLQSSIPFAYGLRCHSSPLAYHTVPCLMNTAGMLPMIGRYDSYVCGNHSLRRHATGMQTMQGKYDCRCMDITA